MKNSFGMGSLSFGRRDKSNAKPAAPESPTPDKDSTIPAWYPTGGAPTGDAPTGSAPTGGAPTGDAAPDPFSDDQNRDVITTIDTLTGYPRIIPQEVKNMTVISSDAEITGELKTQGDLRFMGLINGNIEMKGNMEVTGTVNGNITAGAISVSGGKITGEFLRVEGDAVFDQESALECSITAGNMSASGMIVGDIAVAQMIELHETAVVTGNITARSITVKEGARIDGIMKIGGTK